MLLAIGDYQRTPLIKQLIKFLSVNLTRLSLSQIERAFEAGDY